MARTQTVSVPADLWDRVRLVSKATRVPAARILREIIDAHLDGWLQQWRANSAQWCGKTEPDDG